MLFLFLFSNEFDLSDSICLDTIQQQPIEKFTSGSEFNSWLVTGMTYSEYGSNGAQEKRLQLQHKKNKELIAVCHLRDDWSRMEVDVDDVVLVSSK